MGSEVIPGGPRLPLLCHRHDPLPHVAQVPLLADGAGGGELMLTYHKISEIGPHLTELNYKVSPRLHESQRELGGGIRAT